MWVASFGHDKILHGYALAVGNGEGICLDRLIDRPPHLNDRKAARQQCLGLVGKNLADTIGTGPFSVVVVRRQHRLADELLFPLGLVARAQRVIEDRHTRCSRHLFDQLLDFRIVDRPKLVAVKKVDNLRLVRDKDETIFVQR